MPTELQLKALRALPAVDEVLTTLSRSIPMEVFPHELVVDCIRKEVEAARTMILEDNTAPTKEEIANRNAPSPAGAGRTLAQAGNQRHRRDTPY